MRKILITILKRWLPAALTLACVTAGSGQVLAQSFAGPSKDSNSTALLQKYSALAGQLTQNQYRRPLVLESSENADTVSGDAYAVLDSPFSTVSTTFKSPKHWCEMLILHINTKYCRASADVSPSMLKVNIGKKTAQQLSDAFLLEFAYRLAADSPDYLAAQLNADKGPLGTSNYRMALSAVPLPEGKTFVHLRYSYDYGVASRLAMQGYLATLGRGKVGFTQIRHSQPLAYVEGMRGAVERNTMRYYLAIEAFLDSVEKPASERMERRLRDWFGATERYALQLREIDLSQYMDMKRKEVKRQLDAKRG